MRAQRSSPSGAPARLGFSRCLLPALVLALVLPSAALAQDPTDAQNAQAIEAQAIAGNLVLNFGFETFTTNSATDQVATNWTAFSVSGSPQFRKGTSLFTSPERIEGKDSQVIRLDEPAEGGVYQIDSGLTTGIWYSVVGYVLSIFETSAHAVPGNYDGLVIKQIGVDPYGGRNPLSEDIVWGPLVDKNADRNTWGERLTFQAQQSTATLFIRVECLRGVTKNMGYHTDVFVDAVQLRRSPVSQVTVPSATQSDPFYVSWAASVPSAGSSEYAITEYNVQYRDGIGEWRDWLNGYTGSKALFPLAEAGHSYSFRARAWARYGTAGTDRCEMFGPWAESDSVQMGQALELTVYDNHANTVANVSAQLLDSVGAVAATGKTDGHGVTYLAPGAEGAYDVYAAPPWFLAPEPVLDATVGSGIEPVAVSVRPPDDMVIDGSFEGGTVGLAPAGWAVNGVQVAISDWARHGGSKSLNVLSTSATADVCLSQQFTLADSYSPALMLWYRLMPGPGSVKTFTAKVVDGNGTALATEELQPSADTGWQMASLVISPADTTYSGTVTVEICVRDPSVVPAGGSGTLSAYVDDLSLGRGPGGPDAFYLPQVYPGE